MRARLGGVEEAGEIVSEKAHVEQAHLVENAAEDAAVRRRQAADASDAANAAAKVVSAPRQRVSKAEATMLRYAYVSSVCL